MTKRHYFPKVSRQRGETERNPGSGDYGFIFSDNFEDWIKSKSKRARKEYAEKYRDL